MSHLLNHGIAPRDRVGFQQPISPNEAVAIAKRAATEHGLRAVMDEVRDSLGQDPEARAYFDKMIADERFERSLVLVLSTFGLGLCAVLICDIVSEQGFVTDWHRWNEGERFILRFFLALVGLAFGIKAHDVFVSGQELADQKALVRTITRYYRSRTAETVPDISS